MFKISSFGWCFQIFEKLREPHGGLGAASTERTANSAMWRPDVGGARPKTVTNKIRNRLRPCCIYEYVDNDVAYSHFFHSQPTIDL